MFFLGEIFLPYEFDSYDSPMPSRCGNCRRCIEACPTCAITDEWDFDSERCLSYQLIENRGELSEEAKQSMVPPSMAATVAKQHALGTSLQLPILLPISTQIRATCYDKGRLAQPYHRTISRPFQRISRKTC